MRISILMATALAVCLAAVSCSHDQRTAPQSANQQTAGQPAQKGAVDFRGVHFSYDDSLSAGVTQEILPATPLEDPEDKPDDNWPEHVRFSFKPKDQTARVTFFEPELRVVDVSDYRKAFQVDPKYVDAMDKEITDLKRIIADPASAVRAIPFLPPVDAEQAFVVHVKRIDFNGGRGLAFVTQYNIEPSLVNNSALTWIFQGFTDDEKKYIVVTFPLKCEAAAESNDPEQTHRGYQLPRDFYKDKGNLKAYDAYVEGVKSALERLPSGNFQPSLDRLEKLVREMRVEQ